MAVVTVGDRYEIELPKEVREALRIEPGQQLGIVQVGKSVHLVKLKTLDELRGSLKGMDWSDYRDETDRAS
jgi:AbrB family looped-hinge helix DNA binding protein